MDIITENKVKLIKWLRGDDMILQHVQSGKLITTDEYTLLDNIQDPSNKMKKLLDLILNKGPEMCTKFLDLLKEDDVNDSSPELKQWIATIKPSSVEPKPPATKANAQNLAPTVSIQASGGSSLFAPLMFNVNSGSINLNVNKDTPVRSEDRRNNS